MPTPNVTLTIAPRRESREGVAERFAILREIVRRTIAQRDHTAWLEWNAGMRDDF